MKEQPIYLDSNATTSLDPQVLKAMLAELNGPPSNPSSIHSFGQKAKKLLQDARAAVASHFHLSQEEVLFTSGGTESLNTLLCGLPKGHIITSNVEHSCIDKTVRYLETQGYRATYLPATLWGAPTPTQVAEAICPDTKAIVLSAANSETGVKIDIEAIAQIAQKHNIPFYLDAVAWIGKEPLPLPKSVGAVALSGHKFHGPKGVGALLLRMPIAPLLRGGAQEYNYRAGSENLAGILGLAEAVRLLKHQDQITAHILYLKNHFEHQLLSRLPDLAINGQGPRICNTSNIAFRGCDGETLLLQLDLAGISASHGSACSSGALEPSRILTNMGIDRKTARSSIRFSFSRQNTIQEIDLAIEKIISLVTNLRKF